MRRVLMLDVDGVLVTHRRAGAVSWGDHLQEDLGLSREVLRERFFRPFWGEIVLGRRPLMPTLRDVLDEVGAEVSAEALRDYWFAEDGRVQADVLADVDALRDAGWRVWLCTNQEHERAGYLMGQMGLSRHVEGIVYSAEVGAKKPDPVFYAAAEARAGGGRCVFVDDTEANVVAARAHGWEAHHWRAGDRLKEIVVGNSPSS